MDCRLVELFERSQTRTGSGEILLQALPCLPRSFTPFAADGQLGFRRHTRFSSHRHVLARSFERTG